MSSDFAEFLFSFARNKLESSPQLDLRQQLLHSNLIRHILHVHHSTASASDSSSSHEVSANSTVPQSPPNQPQHLDSTPSSSPSTFSDAQGGSYHHHAWSPFSFNDELDRISGGHHHSHPDHDPLPIQIQDDLVMDVAIDSDVVMEDNLADPILFPTYNLDGGHYGRAFGLDFGQYVPEAQLDYDFESSRAQEDWLDAVLEDLMEQDDEQDESAPEYGPDDDDDDDDDDDTSDSFGDLFDDTFSLDNHHPHPHHHRHRHHAHHHHLPLHNDGHTKSIQSLNMALNMDLGLTKGRGNNVGSNGSGIDQNIPMDHGVNDHGDEENGIIKNIGDNVCNAKSNNLKSKPIRLMVHPATPLALPCQSLDMYSPPHEALHPYHCQSYLHQPRQE